MKPNLSPLRSACLAQSAAKLQSATPYFPLHCPLLSSVSRPLADGNGQQRPPRPRPPNAICSYGAPLFILEALSLNSARHERGDSCGRLCGTDTILEQLMIATAGTVSTAAAAVVV